MDTINDHEQYNQDEDKVVRTKGKWSAEMLKEFSSENRNINFRVRSLAFYTSYLAIYVV